MSAEATTSASRASTTAAFAPTSDRMCFTSAACRRWLTGTTTSPALAQPKCTSQYRWHALARMATRSPCRKPRAYSAAASLLVRSSVCRQVRSVSAQL